MSRTDYYKNIIRPMPVSKRKKQERIQGRERELLIDEKDGKNYFVGNTILDRIETVTKHLSTRRYSKLTLEQYVDYIYNWLLVNPNAYSLLDYFEDLNNVPFPYSYDEVKSVNSQKINELLQERIIKSALNGNARYQFVTELMNERYGWGRMSTGNEDETPQEVEVKF